MSPSALAWKPARDRRVRRTGSPTVDTQCYLEGVLERCSLDAIILAQIGGPDGGRRLVGSAGRPDASCSSAELERAAGALERGDEDAGLDGVDLFAHTFASAGRSYLIATAGKRIDRVRTVIADVSRILG